MEVPDQNVFDGDQYPCGPIDQWSCHKCFKNISPSRPPIYNPENCSCVEIGTAIDRSTQPSHPAAPGQQGYQYQSNAAAYYQQPQSYASSSVSVPGPEGPERDDPNLHLTNTYLPLCPDTGLNEAEHRRSASMHSDMSYQMRRFLIEERNHQLTHGSDYAPFETRFLPQDIHIQSNSKKTKQYKRRSKLSYQSGHSSSGDDHSFIGWGVDPVTGIGDWVDEGAIRPWGHGYPLTMSEMTDSLDE